MTPPDLLWQFRTRGVLPAARHACDASGRVLVVRPDEFETRTYQVLTIAPDGAETETGGISVETVRVLDGFSDGALLLGMTDDDIYLFHHSKKTRFLGDRRALYHDACLSENETFVCAYSDALLSAHGIALAEVSGRLIWSRSVVGQVSRIALCRDGSAVVVGMADGRLASLDARRHLLWETRHDEPIQCLASGGPGTGAAAGGGRGTLLRLDAAGKPLWRASVGVPLLYLGMSDDGETLAAAASDGESHVLLLLDGDGTATWEQPCDSRPTGLALSPGGDFLFVTQVNGAHECYRFTVGSRVSARRSARAATDASTARELAADGKLQEAWGLLRTRLEASPDDLEAAELLAQVQREWLPALQAEAEAAVAKGDPAAAFASLARAREIDPWDAVLVQSHVRVRDACTAAETRRAQTAESLYDWPEAEACWRRVLEFDPGRTDARAALRAIRFARGAELLAAGDACERSGDLGGAMELWRSAEQLMGDEETAPRLARAETSIALQTGIGLYEAGRLREAAFQFRKILSRDPDHEEAARYLGYAEGSSSESGISDRFSRLE